jgi:hypothetical protein
LSLIASPGVIGTLLAEEAARRYSWEKVAKGVIAAAQGRLNELCPLRPAGNHSSG